MDVKQEILNYPENIIAELKKQIEFHEQQIQGLRFHLKVFTENPPEQVLASKANSPLTRDLIRNFFKGYKAPIQTVEMISLLYSGKSEGETDKLVKTLSVILNQLEKEGEISIEKKKGIKGNFYTSKIKNHLQRSGKL